ncbi:hypothetical protein DJ90_5575 [Paenibacillus macerans]|uniref:Uncharacterized protein n=1 Tax=Paenibacillus macerans TaxID=44252 RepID=A0A090XUQ3_PAEMA|nr:hypothetical protein DJ90_5575 [Paenibacillus macerans]
MKRRLFYFYSCACFFQFCFDAVCFFFAHFFFQRLRSVVYQVFGFFQAEARDFANHFDNVDFGCASVSQDHVEFSLFSSFGTAAAATCYNYRSCCSYAKFFFDCFYKIVQFKNGHTFNLFQDGFFTHG